MLGVPPGARVRGAAGLSRLGLRQRLQPARPHLPRDRAGRRASTATTRADIAQLKTRSNSGAMVPIGSVATFSDKTGPYRVTRYNLYPGGRGRRRHRARLLRPASRWTRWRSWPPSLPAGFATEWTGIAFQQEAAGNIAILIFALSVVFVFLVLAAQFESLLLPLAIILIVPMTLLAAMAGVNLRGHGQQHPDPDRPDRADRAGGEERDPDRRVRQAGRGARRDGRSRRRSRRRAPGSARS